MHKLLYFATIGLLAFSIGGCGGGEGSNTASPSPSPSAASPSPTASASPTPGTQTFQSPIVAAQPPGLIRSTNPDERARQAQTGIGDKKDRNPTLPLQPVPQGPVTANPSQLDPFGPLPPITVQNPPGVGDFPGGVPAGPMTANPLPKLPQRQVAMIPKLPELSRPVQIGGTKLRGPAAPQINLSPTARSVVSEFRTLQALLDDTTQYSEYGTDVGELVETIYGREGAKNSTRRQLLLTNRPFFRRIQKALGEYVTASNLWDLYGEKSPPDALRCSIVPEIAEAIEVYRPPTVRRGELSCVTRINLLQAVWRQGKNRLDAALRDQDYEARTIAKAPLLPVLSATPTNRLASLPEVPRLSPPPVGRRPAGSPLIAAGPGDPSLPGGEGAQVGSPRQVPGLNAPQLGSRGGEPGFPGGEGAQVGSPRQVPGLNAPQLGSRPGQPGFPGGEGAQIGSPRQVPGLNTPQLGSRPGQPGLPGGDGAQIGSPPQVPGLNTPQLGGRPTSPPTTGRNPRRPAPPRPPQPIAARPIGVPDLPELPVDKRPPQWRDPNPPPPPQIPAVPAPPPPPSTDLATGTEVSGVVKVGNETQVIVKVPNEPTSRYVKVGQRLSNGQVLVKRVEIKPGADPVVILEENGVEVAKGVGEKPATRQQPANAVISRRPNPNSSTRR
ncbi:hypothetical protein [Microcoleus sp. B9-D4]|uniref:hypothetical protein n=1 Tax=Microcoleus sp. B9-D4 TaxID=2818711 RepID=UPI002FD0FDE9